jgi:hypothetical protein
MDLSQIVQQTTEHLQKYLESLKNYNTGTFFHKKDEATWSLGQMYEHLAISTEFFIRQAEGCLREEKGDFEGTKTSIGEQIFALGGFPPIKSKFSRPSSTKPLLRWLPKIKTSMFRYLRL